MISRPAPFSVTALAILAAMSVPSVRAQGTMSFSEDEVAGEGSLFDRIETSEGGENNEKATGFEKKGGAKHDALACAAGLGCDRVAVSQDEALVLSGHDTAEAALRDYRMRYGDPGLNPNEQGARQEPTADLTGGEMSFTEAEAQSGRFTSAEIASFSQEQDELWACAAAFGCKGAASGLTPHEALHRLGMPEFSYEWPLAACATNAPGACEELGLSLGEALRIMAHLANPNR